MIAPTAAPPRPTTPTAERFWAQAAAFGALWGSIEITLGAFLHSLRLPLAAGILLSSVGAVILVAQRQILPARGASLATALVAAACKSISPGGIILGPMLGIISEGLLVELALLPLPRSRLSAAAAGTLCTLWATTQTLLHQVVIYGTRLLDLLWAALSRAREALGLPPAASVWALTGLALLIALVGAVAGLIGHSIGRASQRRASASPTGPGAELPTADTGNDRTPAHAVANSAASSRPPAARLKGRLLGLLALLCLALQLPGSLTLSALALGLWLTALALADRSALRQLWLPRFWLLTLIIAAASGLLLGRTDPAFAGGLISRGGLAAGLLMVVRGALIFSLVLWASRSLGARDLQRLARRLGLARLGTAAATALHLLPALKAQLVSSPAEDRGRRPRLTQLYDRAVALIGQAVQLADAIAWQQRHQPSRGAARPRLAAVIGPPGSGKTTLLAGLAERLTAAGVAVGGVSQPRQGEDRYLLRDLVSASERPFARRRAGPGQGYAFAAEGWPWARARIAQARRHKQVLIVDELGRLEAQGQGHLPALTCPLSAESARLWVLAVRADCAAAIQERLGPFCCSLPVEADEAQREAFFEQLHDALSPPQANPLPNKPCEV